MLSLKQICLLLVSIVFLYFTTEIDGKEMKTTQVGIKKKVKDCTIKSKNGDKLSMHYTGSLLSNGEVFDSSIPRGQYFDFTLGAGMVIKGWEVGLRNMCIGEKRKLKIPAHEGYGERGSPPKIPGGATLVFEVELFAIDRDGKKHTEL